MGDRWFVHRRLAEEMDSRLQIVRYAPQRIVLVGADGDHSRRLLAARYPQAAFSEYDPRSEFLEQAAAQRKGGWLVKFKGSGVAQSCQVLTAPMPEAAADMLWANLSLLLETQSVPVFETWSHALKPEGLLFFSHFGADTLPEIRDLLTIHGIRCAMPALVDMHDLGDMLFHHGFYDPVMDTAKLVLEYRSAETFWQDMELTGLWQALQISDEAAARRVIEQAWEQGALRQVTLETVYGHAVNKLRLPENESLVKFHPRRP